MKRPFSVYSTWGLHDELGDDVHLTGDLAFAALDRLLELRASHGLVMDVFHLDAFWYDKALGYRHFDREAWPHGPDRLLERLRETGMTLGLWYSLTGSSLNPDAWQASKDPSTGHFSLTEGPYGDDLRDSLFHAARAWGVRFLKFDFCNFWARAEGSAKTPREAYRDNLRRFVEILNELKAAFPGCWVITHTGFGRQEMEPPRRSGRITGTDLSLLEAVDAVFSGDPQSCETVVSSLSRMLDQYQDRQVWLLNQEGFPFDRIEDHGVFAATTNTTLYRDRRGFRRTHLAQLARGARRDLFYGDPRLLTDEDVEGMVATRQLFFDAFERGLETSLVGAGEPGMQPWHGALTGGGTRGLLYLSNPTLMSQRVDLPVTNLTNARLLFHDAADAPSVQVQPDRLTVDLSPEGIALIGLGEYASADPLPQGDPQDTVPRRFEPIIGTWVEGPDGLRLTVPPGSGDELFVTVEVIDAPPHRLQGLSLRVAHQDEHGEEAGVAVHRLLPISLSLASGESVEPVERLPGRKVWSGNAWVAARFAAGASGEIRVENHLDPARRIFARAYRLVR